ncbi:MAG: acyl--CoA ligase [Candidatus Tectomicrobia bacterium]|nr:acyl--CoA ligase [Candidatus Tectomicrobia bacterium]
MQPYPQRPSLTYPEIPVSATLEQTAAKLPEKIAVVDGERTATYGELRAQAWRCAAAMQRLGVRRGDRVGLLLPNSLEFIIAYYGALRAGAVVSTLNPMLTARELEYQLNDAACAALIAHESLMPRVREAGGRLGTLRRRIVVGEEHQEDEFLLHDLLDDASGAQPAPLALEVRRELAVLPYSSGTTGFPKGVMLSHFNLVANMHQFAHACEIRESDVFLTHLPLYHIYGMNLLLGSAVLVGARQVLMRHFTPEACASLIAQHRCTLLFTVPPVILLLSQLPELERHDLSSLRYVFCGAAPLPVEVAQTFSRRTGLLLSEGYGMTETSPMLIANPLGRVKLGSIGTLVSDTEHRIVDAAHGERELGDDEAGELLVRGPQVMLGYWRNRQATAACLRHGWLATGDPVRRDAEGYFSAVERKKEMIKYKGYQVAPAELEAALLEHPEVLDCAVVRLPDAEAGEVPKAFVVRRPGSALDAATLMGFVAARVAAYKRVRAVEFIDAIPKSPSGKILRRLLEKQGQPAPTSPPRGDETSLA